MRVRTKSFMPSHKTPTSDQRSPPSVMGVAKGVHRTIIQQPNGAFDRMKRPAIFFDRDNTLIANDGYLGDPNQVVLIHGAAGAVAQLRSLGFAIVIISN